MPPRPGANLSGGFVFDEKFGVPGRVAAPNLTPDGETGKGAWSDGELMRAFREGVSRDGHALFPMMPYWRFREMSDEDAEAVTAYLRTFPPLHHQVPPAQIDFPANLLIKLAPKPLAGPVHAPDDERDHLGYGRYLVTLAGCQECHTPRDAHGKLDQSRAFTGGQELRGPWGRVVSANLTPDEETFVGQATRDEFIGRFKAFAPLVADPPLAPRGRNTVMPWLAFSGMTERDLGAIYDYLRTLKPVHHRVVSFPDAPAQS
jgi:mono/diheme cytochrome c family protein